MKTFLTVAFSVSFSAVSFAQSDLQKIGQFLNDLQQMQQQQNNQPPNGTRSAPYKVDPNSSGNRNTGNFGRQDFFGPNGRGQSGRSGQMYPGNSTYPGNTTYPNGSYPGNTYPNNRYPQGTYPGTQQTYPSSSGRTTSRYPDPPVAPAKRFSGQPIRISCSADSVGMCQYELKTASGSKFPYTISAGKSQSLSETTSWVFRYRPTTSAAWQEYRLRGGRNYVVRNTGGQWQLYMMP